MNLWGGYKSIQNKETGIRIHQAILPWKIGHQNDGLKYDGGVSKMRKDKILLRMKSTIVRCRTKCPW